MTILNSTRAFSIGKDIDISAIKDASKFILPVDINWVNALMFWKELGFTRKPVSIPRKLAFSTYHITTKVSPYLKTGNGLEKKNALWHSVGDLVSLPSELIKSIKIVGGDLLTARIDTILESVKRIPELGYFINIKASNNFRKISAFPDKELKVRVIAIGDYFSQTALRPLHKYLFRILKRIPQDRTFDQGAMSSILGKEIYYSLDLSSATDRFPIQVISLVLKGHLPKIFVDAWEHIMIGYPFKVPQTKEEISYAVGNPMGFYSSWASFALAHHFILYIACKRVKIEWKTSPYLLLGDDLLIAHKELAEAYKDIMKSLDVGISEPKSFISPHFFEFAKRQFWRGVEVTPFPISSLKESLKGVSSFVSSILESEVKGWTSSIAPEVIISTAYAVILHMRSSYRSKMEDKVFVADRVLRCIRGTLPAGEAIKSVFSRMGYTFDHIADSVGLSILENIVVDLFSQQPEMKFDKDAPSQFELAHTLTLLLTGLDEERLSLGFDAIQALPHTSVYGLIEETYMSLISKARTISTTTGEWPLLFKTLALPGSDAIFVERSAKTVSRISSKVAGALRERGSILVQYPQLLRGMATLHRPPQAVYQVQTEKSFTMTLSQFFLFWRYVFYGIMIYVTIIYVIKYHLGPLTGVDNILHIVHDKVIESYPNTVQVLDDNKIEIPKCPETVVKYSTYLIFGTAILCNPCTLWWLSYMYCNFDPQYVGEVLHLVGIVFPVC